MTSLILAACSALGVASPAATPLISSLSSIVMMRVEIPVKVPAGWKREERERGAVLTPGDVAEGRLYAVTITPLEGKAGTLDGILEEGKKGVAALGAFQPAMEPRKAASEGGWDYEFVIGAVETKAATLIAQVTALKHGDDGGLLVVLSDSVETMTTYADALATLLRGLGSATSAPPANPVSGDVEYAVPPGWVETRVEGFPSLVKEKNETWTKYRVSLLVFPSEPLGGSVRDRFTGYWKAFVTPNYTTKVVPMPLIARLQSGYACAFDADSSAVDKSGATMTVAIFMLAHGGRVAPVLGIYAGSDWSIDGAIEAETGQILASMRIRGASSEKVALFDAKDLAGEWSESSSEFANYVTRSGQYAGDATITTGTYFDLAANGSYTRTLIAISSGARIKEKDTGTWTVEDDELVLVKGGRYSLLGYGSDPKAGRFLVLGNYSNVKTRLRLTNPRGILQALWLKAK